MMVSPLTFTSPGKRPWTRIVAQQMRVGLDRPEIVDADDLDILAPAFGDRAQHKAADAAEAVDGNPRHVILDAFLGFPSMPSAAGSQLTCPQ